MGSYDNDEDDDDDDDDDYCRCLQSLYDNPVFKRCCVFKNGLRSEIIATIKVCSLKYSFTIYCSEKLPLRLNASLGACFSVQRRILEFFDTVSWATGRHHPTCKASADSNFQKVAFGAIWRTLPNREQSLEKSRYLFNQSFFFISGNKAHRNRHKHTSTVKKRKKKYR